MVQRTSAALRIAKPLSIRRKGPLTFEDFVDLVPDGQKADLLDGVIYMASPDNTVANEENCWLGSLLFAYVEFKGLGKVFLSRVAYRLAVDQGPEPDIGFLPKKKLRQQQRGFIAGPPALAVEIVSPDSVERDYVHKREIYEQAGVQEYWIIDEHEKRVTFLVLRRGRLEERKPVKHIWRSKAVPGFWLDVRWLWSEDRPPVYTLLQRLLGED